MQRQAKPTAEAGRTLRDARWASPLGSQRQTKSPHFAGAGGTGSNPETSAPRRARPCTWTGVQRQPLSLPGPFEALRDRGPTTVPAPSRRRPRGSNADCGVGGRKRAGSRRRGARGRAGGEATWRRPGAASAAAAGWPRTYREAAATACTSSRPGSAAARGRAPRNLEKRKGLGLAGRPRSPGRPRPLPRLPLASPAAATPPGGGAGWASRPGTSHPRGLEAAMDSVIPSRPRISHPQ